MLPVLHCMYFQNFWLCFLEFFDNILKRNLLIAKDFLCQYCKNMSEGLGMHVKWIKSYQGSNWIPPNHQAIAKSKTTVHCYHQRKFAGSSCTVFLKSHSHFNYIFFTEFYCCFHLCSWHNLQFGRIVIDRSPLSLW